MKRKLILFLALTAALLMVVPGAMAGGGSSADWAGDYSIQELTIDPPVPAVDWINDTATVTVGSTYNVNMYVDYEDSRDPDDEAFVDEIFATATIDGRIVWTDSADAVNLFQDNVGEDDTDSADYYFYNTITVAEWMAEFDEVVFSVYNNTAQTSLVSEITASYTVTTQASNPVPEPASLMLLGMGLLGTAGFRKKKRG